MGHFFPLAFDNFPKELKTCLESERRDMSSWALFRQGEFVLGCRSIWIAGQMGSWLLPEAIQMHLEAPVPLVWLWTFFSLMIIAIREQSHRQEIIEVIQRNISEHDLVVKYLGSMEKEVYMSLFHPLFCPEEVLEGWKESCQKAFFEEQSSITRTRQYQFGSIAGIPPDLACTLSVNLVGDLINDQISAISLSHATPWLAQASLADLYLPEDYKEFSDKETWEPQNAIDLISIRTTYYGPRKPIARTNLPGRNDPCSCGSGKKYKHCCQK